MSPLVHHQYVYTSERLLREVYDQATARSRGRIQTTSATVTTPIGVGLNVGLGRPADQPDNVFWLAEYALRALKDQIGPLSTTAEGRYLRTVLELTCCQLPVSNISTTVAWMYADCDDPQTGRTLVGLCGSIKNYRDAVEGSPSPDTNLGDLWNPSSLSGLRRIFAARAEDEALNDALGWEGEKNPIHAAMDLRPLPGRYIIGEGWKEILVEVLLHAPAPHNRDGYDTIVLGAPLWVRTAAAQPVRSKRPPVRKPSSDIANQPAGEPPVGSNPHNHLMSVPAYSPMTAAARGADVAGATMAGVGGLLIILGSVLPWFIAVDPVLGSAVSMGCGVVTACLRSLSGRRLSLSRSCDSSGHERPRSCSVSR